MEEDGEINAAASSSDEEGKDLKKEEKKLKKPKCRRKRCVCVCVTCARTLRSLPSHRLLTINVTNCKYDSGRYLAGLIKPA